MLEHELVLSGGKSDLIKTIGVGGRACAKLFYKNRCERKGIGFFIRDDTVYAGGLCVGAERHTLEEDKNKNLHHATEHFLQKHLLCAAYGLQGVLS
jgi:hypothetical protein